MEREMLEKTLENLRGPAGRKDDSGKLPWHLLPWEQVAEIVKVLKFGAGKYAPENWKLVPNARERYFDAALRHITAWFSGVKKDPETNLSHLAHAGCCILFLMWGDRDT